MVVCVELLPKFCLQISFKLLDKNVYLDLMFMARGPCENLKCCGLPNPNHRATKAKQVHFLKIPYLKITPVNVETGK